MANSAPLIAPNGVLNIFRQSIGDPLAPGSVIQIYGTNLATATKSAASVPLSATLAGTSVSIGGLEAPLFYVSPGQINAQVPFELAAGMQYNVQVSVNGTLSATPAIAVASAAPAIAALPSGAAIAQHSDFSLVSESAPAQPGETIILYLAGLGATDTPVATGTASPYSPLAHPTVKRMSPPFNPAPGVMSWLCLSGDKQPTVDRRIWTARIR